MDLTSKNKKSQSACLVGKKHNSRIKCSSRVCPSSFYTFSVCPSRVCLSSVCSSRVCHTSVCHSSVCPHSVVVVPFLRKC